MAILASHGIAEAKGTRNTLKQGPRRAIHASMPKVRLGHAGLRRGARSRRRGLQLAAWSWLSWPIKALQKPRAHAILCNKGLGVQVRRQRPRSGLGMQTCGEEPVLVDEDGN
jgi:hypothetical protein